MALRAFCKLLIASSKANLLCHFYIRGLKCCLLLFQLFAKIFSKNLNLVDSGISLPAFPSWTNLKVHNILVTPKLITKIITNLELSKMSGPVCLSVVILKRCEPELSYMLAEFFNVFLKISCFPDY